MNAPVTTDLSDPVLADLVEAITARLNAGETPNIDDIAREHPAQADALRALLPALRIMQTAGASPADSPPPQLGTLGDFRLLREVGRGGMGVVYEAEQISLNRRVALKVLPFAATLDARHLQRFKTEALAAATLDHPNIVSVYGVGVERGVHYYAMRFIDGRTLADVIAEWRGEAATQPEATSAYVPGAPSTSPIARLSTKSDTPATTRFRTVAEIGAQVAEALDHAHLCGIIHRDIKPANLLLDAAGKVWVTDFGLAQVQTDARLTMTGDLLGTLRYMSPEQALAKRVPVDPRTDVYSLGVTLYEMLTREPAFGGSDRQELLRQIAFEEPVAPRKRDRSIPTELEVIVMKAMAKNPAERYATAGELADDLRAFLADRPIKARPPGFSQRVAKWGRRNKTVVRAAAVVAGLALLALVVTTAVIAEAKARTDRALDAEKAAAADRDRALENAQRKQAETDAALQNEIEAKRALQQSLEREQHLRYAASLAAADREFRDGNLYRAKQLLHGLPPALRGWEWHYLNRIGHGEIATLGAFNPTTYYWKGTSLVSPDCRSVLTRTETHYRLWDTFAGKELACIERPRGQWPIHVPPDAYITPWAFSPDSARVFLAHGKHVQVCDGATGATQFTLEDHADAVTLLAIAPNGRRLAVASADHVVTVWELDNPPRIVTRYREHPTAVHEITFASDSRHVVSRFGNASAWVQTLPERVTQGTRWWDSETGTTFGPSDVARRSYRLTPDRSRVIATGDGAVELLPLAGGPPERRLEGCTGIAVAPGGQRLFATKNELPMRMTLFNLQTGDAIATFDTPGGTHIVVFSPDGRRALILGLGIGFGRGQGTPVVDTETGRILYSIPTPGTWEAVFSPDGSRLAINLTMAAVRIHDAATGEELGIYRGHQTGLRDMQFSPDGRHLLTADSAGVIKVWDVTRPGDGWTRLTPPPVLGRWRDDTTAQQHTSLAISANGQRIAVASEQIAIKKTPFEAGEYRTVVRLYDLSNGSTRTFLLPPRPLPHEVVVALSSSGRYLACAEERYTYRRGREGPRPSPSLVVWDVETEQEIVRRTDGLDVVLVLGFAGEELRVISVPVPQENTAPTGNIRVWRAKDGATLREIPAPQSTHPTGLWVSFTPDAQRVLVSRYSGPYTPRLPPAPAEASVWDVAGGDRPPIRLPFAPPGPPPERAPDCVDATPDGRRVLMFSVRGCDLHDTASATRLGGYEFPMPEPNSVFNIRVRVVKLGPDGRRVFFADERKAVILDAMSGGELAVLRLPGTPHMSAWSADGQVIAVLGRDGQVYVWDGTPLIDKPPPHPKVLHDLAWELVTHPDPKQHDAPAAVRLAKQAVERMPSYGDGWLALGIAEYRTGNFATAIEALKKCLDREPTSPAAAKYFLAMAHARLGLFGEARRWFDEANRDAGKVKERARSEELRRFQVEATTLIPPG